MPSLGMAELVIILVLALIIFGPGKLPGVGQALGKTVKEFKTASKEELDKSPEPVKTVETHKAAQN